MQELSTRVELEIVQSQYFLERKTAPGETAFEWQVFKLSFSVSDR